MVSGRDFRREFAGLLERLEKGELEKLVLLRHGKMVAVVTTVEDYARLAENRS
jgi:prevent-host-death family protein